MALIWKIEAILFAAGEKMPVEQLAKLTRSEEEDVRQELGKLQKIYAGREGSLALFEEGDAWKLNVKETFLPLVRKIVAKTELSKSIMETLAVIAWKTPIKQSELVDIRSNKAYDHVHELAESGFIVREPFGRTYVLKLTQKFYDYFELAEQDIKKRFSKFEDLEKAMAPQRNMVEYVDPEKIRQQKFDEFDAENAELAVSIDTQQKQDEGFLTDIDDRIRRVGEEGQKNAQEFADELPQDEPIDDAEEAGSEKD